MREKNVLRHFSSPLIVSAIAHCWSAADEERNWPGLDFFFFFYVGVFSKVRKKREKPGIKSMAVGFFLHVK